MLCRHAIRQISFLTDDTIVISVCHVALPSFSRRERVSLSATDAYEQGRCR